MQIKEEKDPEFKRNAVLLAEEPGRSVKDFAENLGTHPDLIYQGRKKLQQQGEIAFPGHGNLEKTKHFVSQGRQLRIN